MQEKWIGQSKGADIHVALETGEIVTLFTTRHETLFGMSYIALALDHPIVQALQVKNIALKNFTKKYLALETEEKIGFDLSVKAINPVTGDKVSVFGWPTMFYLIMDRALFLDAPPMIREIMPLLKSTIYP